MNQSEYIDVDEFISEVLSILELKLHSIDKLNVSLDLKDYIYKQANLLEKSEEITLNSAVTSIVREMGSPQEFAERFIRELASEKKYLLLKVILAIFIASFPILLMILKLFNI